METEINSGVAEMQKLETKMSRNKETYDRLRSDLKSRKDEQSSLQRSREGKEKSLTSLESSLESMKVRLQRTNKAPLQYSREGET